MTWRDTTRRASFRGIEFAVRRANQDGGAATDEHRFPGAQDATQAIRIAPLGAGPRRYVIDAYVFGDDYNERRDALEAALYEGTPGRLVHPYRGERTVSISGRPVTYESPDRGGYARITFNCYDVTEGGLRSVVDTGALAERALDATIEQLALDFENSLTNTEGVTLEDAQSAWQSGQSRLRDAAAHVSDLSTAAREATSR
ncbi:MAG: DNA circularization N-terminal domain-containing protein, partial [Myxococcota bacterium]